jgi:hypothetical protein
LHFHNAFGHELAQPVAQNVLRKTEALLKLAETTLSPQRIPHDEQRPGIAAGRPSRKRGLRRPFCGSRKALCTAAVDQDALLLFHVRVIGEELDFVAVGQPQHTFASVALEGGRCHEPNPLFDYRVAAELAFKGEFDVPQSR